MRTRLAGILCTLVLGAVSFRAPAEDWPQWRGPNLNGSSNESDLPARFSTEENVRWVVTLPGSGAATPIVSGKRVFISSTDRASGNLLAMCYEADSGELLWSRSTGKDRRARNNNMASPSPVTDGKTVCFTYGTGQLHAFTVTGEPRWQRDLENEFGGNNLMFGYSASPLLLNDHLYLPVIRNSDPRAYRRQPPEGTPPGPLASYSIAMSLATGKTLWRRDRPTDAVRETLEAYATPVPRTVGDRHEILVFGADYVTAHDAQTGEELWRWGEYNPTKIFHWRIVTCPVVWESKVFVVAPKHAPLYALSPVGSGRLDDTVVSWQFERETPDASTPLLYRGKLFVLNDDRKKLSCLDPASGDVVWQGDLGGSAVFRASLTGADGRLYVINEAGEAFVLATTRFAILHQTNMGGRPARSTIAAANGCLYIRTPEKLFCIGR